MAVESGAAIPSFRPDLFEIDPPCLLASVCTECDAKTFPPREVCANCGGASRERRERLGSEGVVYAFTVVHTAPKGLTTPYVLAYVDLPDDGVRVLSRIVGAEPDELAVGQRLRLAAAPAEPAPAEPATMFVFTP